jgi:hypothetical protein
MHRLTAAAALACALIVAANAAEANYGWTFTFQGELKKEGTPVNGTANLDFKLFDAAAAGTQVGPTITMAATPVTNGVLTVDLDFTNGGVIAGVFDGNDRWLEIVVEGTTLTPRRQIHATPHAVVSSILQMPWGQRTVAPLAMKLVQDVSVPQSRALLVQTTSTDTGATAIMGECTVEHLGNGIGVMGISRAGNGFGVIGTNLSPSGNCTGVYGNATSPFGYGVLGIAGSTTGPNKGVYGATLSPDGWAGGFDGRGYFTGDLGVGDSLPAARLEVFGGTSGGQALKVNDDLYVNTSGFVGVGRSNQVTAAEIFGVRSPVATQNSYGGMYMETVGATSRPFYGYSAGGGADAWTYYDGTTAQWRVSLSGFDRLTLDPVNGFGVKRAAAANDFEVEGTASKTTAGSWLANSDARIKTDVRTVHDALSTLDRVRLVDFRYTDAYRTEHPSIGDRRYHNVIAQEFAQVFPDYVHASGEKLPNGDDILQVDTYPLTIYSAAAVQELHKMLQAKDAEIAALRTDSADMHARLAKLESALAALNAAGGKSYADASAAKGE